MQGALATETSPGQEDIYTGRRAVRPIRPFHQLYNKGKASKSVSKLDPSKIQFLQDVALEISVELGRADVPISRVKQLKKGSVCELQKLSGEPLDVRVNGKLVARGEAVIVNEMFGVRVTQIVAPIGEEAL